MQCLPANIKEITGVLTLAHRRLPTTGDLNILYLIVHISLQAQSQASNGAEKAKNETI